MPKQLVGAFILLGVLGLRAASLAADGRPAHVLGGDYEKKRLQLGEVATGTLQWET